MYQVILPTKVKKSKKKFFHLNLNQYRNAHHRTLSKVKNDFTEEVLPLVKHIPFLKKIRIEYYLFVGSRQSCDVPNVCSIVDKFFQDTLTKAGVLEDDNYKIVPEVSYHFGGYEKDNGRVEARIIPLVNHKETPEKEQAVQLKITEVEIKKAVTMYVNSLGLDTTGKNVEIDLQATRGPEGYTALIDVTEGGDSELASPKAKPTPTPSPAPTKEKASSESDGTPEPKGEPQQEGEAEASADAPAEDSNKEGAEEDAPKKPTSGLFGNLQKPKND